MSEQPLVKNPYADLNTDHSTSLPGFVAEEIIEENYGSTNLSMTKSHGQDTENDNDNPNNGYLLPFNQTVAVLVPLYSLVFLASLDSTILSTLMTDIASDLNAIPYISWIATAYLFSTSIVQPLGKLSDIFGRKSSLLVCISIFIVGCLQCAMATSVYSFSSGRFLSGFAAGLNSLSSIITTDLIPLRNRGVYQGLGNIFYALGSAVGGTCGGWISQNWGWRMAFWFQIPIGICAFLVIFFFFNLPQLPHEIEFADVSTSDKLKKIDIKGISLIAFNLFILILVTSVKFDSWIYYLILAAVFVIGLIKLYQVENDHEFAIIPMEIMKNRSVLSSSLANWFGSIYSYVLIYYFPVYLTTVLDISSEGVGIRLVPNIIIISGASILSGFYMKWSGKYLKFSIIVAIFGNIGLAYMLYRTFPGVSPPSLFEQYSLNILSLSSYGSMLTVTLLALIASVPLHFQSSVTSIQYAFRSVGSTLGTSVSSFIFTFVLDRTLTSKLVENKPDNLTNDKLFEIINNALHDAKFIRSKNAPKWAIDLMVYSYNISVWYTFVFAMVASLFGMIAISMMKENKLHTSVQR